MRETVTEAAAPRRRIGTEDWIAVALIAGFFVVNLIGLDRVPFANADEAWIAEPGLRFWEGGGFVSRLHAGFFGTERHFLMHAPLFSLITGWMVWIFGHGLVQVRIVSLAMAALTAAFTYRLGRTLLSPRHGLIAVLLLTWCRTGPYQWEARQSGIVLVDFGRYARYDIAVPFFGLIGMMLILPWLLRDARADGARDARGRCVCGSRSPALVRGLATTSHPIGLIWIATLIVSCLIAGHARGERPAGAVAAIAPIAWILLGAGIALLPWILFAYAGWNDLTGQMQFHGGRLTARRSVVLRIERADGMAALHQHRPRPAVRHPRRVAAGTLRRGRAAALVFGARHTTTCVCAPDPRRTADRRTPAVTLRARQIHPLLRGDVALGRPDRRDRHSCSPRNPPRASSESARSCCSCSAVSTASAPKSNSRARPPRVSSYATIADRLASHIPRDARVMGLPTWWFALEPHVRDYRSLTVPMFFLDIDDPTGRTFTERLDAIDADVLLLDQAMIDYIHGPRGAWAKGPGTRNPGAEDLERFVATRSVRRVDLADPSYGRFEIYYLRRTSDRRPRARRHRCA